DAVGPGGVHVVGVLPDEVDIARLVQAGAGGGVLVVVAEGQGPGDAAVLHRPHHVVQRLLRLPGGAGRAVADAAVEDDDVGPDVLEHRVLQCDRATVGAGAVLGVVELDGGEGAVVAEAQLTAHDAVLRGLGRPAARSLHQLASSPPHWAMNALRRCSCSTGSGTGSEAISLRVYSCCGSCSTSGPWPSSTR